MQQGTASDRHAILVAGYYRSGTSALSGGLADMGVAIEANAEGNEHNPKGFFEHTALIKHDIKTFEALRVAWSDVALLPEDWVERADITPYRERLTSILSDLFRDRPLVGVKHPHLCRLFPLYARAITDLGYSIRVIHTHRSPFAIATSQAKKNGVSRAHSLLLWASYICEAEKNARGLPRTWVFYDDLLQDSTAAVRRALTELGISSPQDRSVEFVTKTLKRSGEADREGLFGPVASLIDDMTAAITQRIDDPDIWTGFRQRVTDLADFLIEIGETRSRVAPGIGAQTTQTQFSQDTSNLAITAQTNALRPAEYGDDAERKRLLGQLSEATPPSVRIAIAAPQGTSRQDVEQTLDSIKANWRQPDTVTVHLVNPDFSISADTAFEIIEPDDQALARSIYGMLSTAETGYAAIINAGDRIEPDAIARFALRAARSGADLLYCDEIVTAAQQPWIRVKAAPDIHRLRTSCYIGDWVWYRPRALAEIGGIASDLPGAEEHDAHLRLMEAGYRIERIENALFVRGIETRRDSVALDSAITNAVTAIRRHLERCGIQADVTPGSLPGIFSLAYKSTEQTPLIVALDCSDSDVQTVLDANQHVVGSLREGDQTVYLAPNTMSDDLRAYLDKVKTDIHPQYPGIDVMPIGKNLGETLSLLQARNTKAHVVFMRARSAPANADPTHHVGVMLDQFDDIGVVGAKNFYEEKDGTTHLVGPLLFAAPSRVGAGRDALNPGPGGWLAADQMVDAVDGALIGLRAGLHVPDDASTWVEVCAAARSRDAHTLWTPSIMVAVPRPADGARDPELEAAEQHAYTGVDHHATMTLLSDPLFLEGRSGLVCDEPEALLTGQGLPQEGAIISAARSARILRGSRIRWLADPVDAASIRRARQQGRPWVRINPFYDAPEPGTGAQIPCDVAVWTALPTPSARPLVRSAKRNIATSRAVLNAVRGMGGTGVDLWLPRLFKDGWQALAEGQPRSGKPVALWIDQGVDVPWLLQMIEATKGNVSWLVASIRDMDLPETVGRIQPPVLEDGWLTMFSEMRPHILVRPTPKAPWLDDYVPLLGLAGGCHVLTGRESPLSRDLPVEAALPSDSPDKWTKAVERLADQPSSTARSALFEMPELWQTEDSVFWLPETPVSSSDSVRRAA